MFTIEPLENNVFTLKVSGKLTHADYRDHLIPALEKAISEHGALRLLIEAEDFQGWQWQAAFDDFKMGVKHHRDFEKVAIVGDKAWEAHLVKMVGFFVKAEARYFDHAQLSEAKTWVAS